MLKINSNPTQNITCLSLVNITWENVYHHSITFGLCDFQMELLKEQYDIAQSKMASNEKIFIDTLFIIDDFIFLGVTKNCTESIAPYIELQLDFMQVLKCPLSIEKEVLNTILENKSFDYSADVFESLELGSKRINTNYPLKHLNDFIIIEIPVETITAFDIINKYQIQLNFCNEEENIDLEALQLQNLYYKNRTIVAFDFKNKTTSEIFKAWNTQFIEAILNLSPINLSMFNKTQTLNLILDKISTQGISELSQTQIEFLSAF